MKKIYEGVDVNSQGLEVLIYKCSVDAIVFLIIYGTPRIVYLD